LQPQKPLPSKAIGIEGTTLEECKLATSQMYYEVSTTLRLFTTEAKMMPKITIMGPAIVFEHGSTYRILPGLHGQCGFLSG